MQHQLLQTGCSKAKFANTTTPLTRLLDDGPIGGQVSGVSLYVFINSFYFICFLVILFSCIFSAPPDNPCGETDCSDFNFIAVVFYRYNTKFIQLLFKNHNGLCHPIGLSSGNLFK